MVDGVTLAFPERYCGKHGLTARAVLLALGTPAQVRGTRYVAFGQRSLSLAAGRDHTRVGAALRRLREEPDPFLVLLECGRGPTADLNELRIPDAYAVTASTRRWPSGLIPRVHALFAAGGLGLPAFFVHQALHRSRPAGHRRRARAGHRAVTGRGVRDLFPLD